MQTVGRTSRFTKRTRKTIERGALMSQDRGIKSKKAGDWFVQAPPLQSFSGQPHSLSLLPALAGRFRGFLPFLSPLPLSTGAGGALAG